MRLPEPLAARLRNNPRGVGAATVLTLTTVTVVVLVWSRDDYLDPGRPVLAPDVRPGGLAPASVLAVPLRLPLDLLVEMLEAEPLDSRLERLSQPQPNGRLVELPCRRCGHRVELLLVARYRNLTELLLKDGLLVFFEADREMKLGLSALGRPMFPQVDGEVRGSRRSCRRNRLQYPSSRRRVTHAATVPPLDPRAESPLGW